MPAPDRDRNRAAWGASAQPAPRVEPTTAAPRIRDPLPYPHERPPFPTVFACQMPERVDFSIGSQPFIIWAWTCPGCMAGLRTLAETQPELPLAHGLVRPILAAEAYAAAPDWAKR